MKENVHLGWRVISVKINTSGNSPRCAVKKRLFSSTHEISSTFYKPIILISLKEGGMEPFPEKKSC